DNVEEEIKSRRLQELIDRQSEWSLASNRRDIGKIFEVMVEGISKKSDNEMSGRTSQNKVVVFPAKDIPMGSFIQVQIKDCTSATLIGEQIK
ncbi:MAG: TRAM domain-containing protein, partial [Odoribacter sp.]